MSAPKIIVQIAIAGAQIFGKAFLAASRQAIQNAKHRPDGAMGGADVSGIRNATSGSYTDRLTREHRMTLDEAHLILNTKKDQPMESILQHFEHLFKANTPAVVDAATTAKPKAGSRQPLPPAHSHYVQSKVIRARERIEAELNTPGPEQPPTSNSAPPPSQNPPPPPPESGKTS